MSFDLTRLAWDVKGIDAQARLVLLLLADVADNGGNCWPSVAFMAEKTGLGERAIRYRLTQLTESGLVSRTRRHRPDGTLGTYDYILHLPACGAASPPACGAAQEPTISEPTNSSSLRSEEEVQSQVVARTHNPTAGAEAAKAYWDWHVADRSVAPTQTFLALRAVARSLAKRGYTDDEIVDAMKLTKVMTAKAVSDEAAAARHAKAETVNTQRIPAGVVRAFAKCDNWFHSRGVMMTPADRQRWMRLCAAQVNFGFGVGETMLRMAVALRDQNESVWALSDAKIDRFPGEPADYPDAMERAYRNRHWSAR